MDLEARKISFVQEFLRIQNESIISGLEKLLKKKKTEAFESKLKPMNKEKLYSEIDQAINDSENNRIIKASDLKSKYR